MKSWRFTGTNEPLQLAELPEPTAGPGQVVVDVKAAGICHTDVGILTDPGWMTMLAQVPVTLGHEDAGVISQVGEGVDDFRVGDRVAICPTTPAGCPGSSFDGGFGPKIVVGTQALVRIPDEVDFVNGAAATDAGMTSYAAVVRRGGVKAGDRVFCFNVCSTGGGGDVLLDFVVCMVVGQCTGWFQATSPSWMRLSMMLMPYSVLMRLSRYQTMYSSSIAVNSSIVTPWKLLLWKNSCLRRPKNPSAAALSGEQPFALIDRVSPCSVQMRIHSGHR